MSFKIAKKGNDANPNQTDFICDERSDIDILPTNISWGSTAFVIDDSSVWMLNSKGIWKEI